VDKNNPKYVEFKEALIWDSSFESFFSDLESVSANTLESSDILSFIERESWWVMSFDLSSDNPTSNMSLVWSEYGFSESIDREALSEIMSSGKDEL
jgi:hypothetical protein